MWVDSVVVAWHAAALTSRSCSDVNQFGLNSTILMLLQPLQMHCKMLRQLILYVHLEIRTPNVVAANGNALTDASVLWDLHFASSGTFEYITKQNRAEIDPILVRVDADTPDRNDPSTPPAPPAADWSAVYAAGVAYGASPLAAWQSAGKAGTYDFTRWGQTSGNTDQTYRPATAFAGGVYLNGAEIPKTMMDTVLELVVK